MLGNGNTLIKYRNAFPLKIGVGVQWEELSSSLGGSIAAAIPPGRRSFLLQGGLALPAPPLGSAKTIVSSDAIQKIAQRRKEQTGTCGLRHMRDCWHLYSKYV